MAFKLVRNSPGGSPIIETVTVSTVTASAGSLLQYTSGLVKAGANGSDIQWLAQDAIAAADTSATVIKLQAGDILEADYTATVSGTAGMVGDFFDMTNAAMLNLADTTEGTDGRLRLLSYNNTTHKARLEFLPGA